MKPIRLSDEITGAPDLEKYAQTYDGYIYDANDKIVGTIQVKAAKAKLNRKTGVSSSKVTASVVFLDTGKKVSLKNGVAAADGSVSVMSSAGGDLAVQLGGEELGGILVRGGVEYGIDGARSVFAAKDAQSKADAAQILAKRKGRSYAIAIPTPDGRMDCLTATIGAKGKVKVSGTTGAGVKVSATSQLLCGADGRMMIPVVVSKKAKMSFGIWLEGSGVTVTGIEGAVAGETGKTLGATVDFGELPSGYSRFTDAKSEALKLKLTVKTGAVKGMFKLATTVNGRVKKASVSVTGVQIGGVAYCVATIKRVGSWLMTVSP